MVSLVVTDHLHPITAPTLSMVSLVKIATHARVPVTHGEDLVLVPSTHNVAYNHPKFPVPVYLTSATLCVHVVHICTGYTQNQSKNI